MGDNCNPDQHLGFIKFGSRVDLYLPLGSGSLCRNVEQPVLGNQDSDRSIARKDEFGQSDIRQEDERSSSHPQCSYISELAVRQVAIGGHVGLS